MQNKLRSKGSAFTLVEVLIVVAILGMLAAVIVPEYKNHTQRAKEASAKESLQILRTTIERYALDHHGVPPGYPLDDPWYMPDFSTFYRTLAKRQQYLSKIPANPFNGMTTATMIADDQPFPAEADGSSGWIYKPAAKQIRLNQPGTDSQGMAYFDY